MASTVEVTSTTQVPLENAPLSTPVSNLRPNVRGTGRHRNRGPDRRRNPEQQDSQDAAAQSPHIRSSQQRRGGGRANNTSENRRQTGAQLFSLPSQPPPPLDPPPGPGGGGTSGNRLTRDAKNAGGEILTINQDDGGDEVETEVCFICASPVVHHSVAPCNHRTCHICALRLRALYKTRACAHCRSEASDVIFTDNPNKGYDDFVDADFQKTDDVLGIKYEQKEIYDDTLVLLRYNCPEASCDIACWGWPDLHRHVKSLHRKVMCDLCTRNKKVFTHEHELFTVAELRKHEKFGDDNPGAVDQSGFKGHPECGFCRQRFYGDDELYTHCRDKHEKCHICDRRNHGRQQQYYVDYESLEIHFRKDHFLCADQECLDKKFVVFESEMDLKAHQLQVHPNDLSKDARKDARRVDISSFDYRTPHAENLGRRERDGRNAGRGRDPNTDPLPQSTPQPLRRDELAYQRQMAIQSAQSVSVRNFGGQLTSHDAPAIRHDGRSQDPATITAPRSRPSSYLATNDHQLSAPASPSPQEQARRLQHASVTDRASAMAKGDPLKESTFRAAVSSYQSSQLTAYQFLDALFSLFDMPSTELGKLVRELANLYETDSKREDLLKAWNDWRAINQDYPSLPGPGGGGLPGSSSATTGAGGGHVLRLKSSTAQSSRSAVSKQSSWGNAADSNPFPAISLSAHRAGAGRVAPTPWIAASASSAPSSSRLSSLPTSSASDAFPALPAATKPKSLVVGLTKRSVRWDAGRGNNNSAVNPWSGNAGTVTKEASNGAEVTAESEAEGAGKKKSGKGKKQTLYKFG